ncbi:MAG: superoxide dismutase [Anaerolineae bacterium]|jgi:streptogramin lyase
MFKNRFSRFVRKSSLPFFAASLITLALVAAIPMAPAAAMVETFPSVIPLPDGFAPEGIAVGRDTTFYVGSLVDGAIYAGDLRSGEGDVLVPGVAGRVAVGLDVDVRGNRLFVSGGPTGQAYVYDAASGAHLATFALADPAAGATFINDVIVTRDAAFFTDSSRPTLYRLPLGSDGALPAASEPLPLSGDFQFEPGQFNANGIEAKADGGALIVVNSYFGTLYNVDPDTGVAQEIALIGGGSVPNGDGILLVGQDLFVVQNFFNQIAEIRLDPLLETGLPVNTLTTADAPFRIPTTAARFGSALYVVNARFDVPAGPTVEYEVVKVKQK